MIVRPDAVSVLLSRASVDVVVANLDGTAATGVPVTLALTRVQWNSVRRAEGAR